VLSIPSAILVAIAAAARHGILFRGGVAIENLAGVTQFAFDKTGTLTKGALVVSKTALFQSHSEDSLLQIAGSIAQLSTHPLARAITRELEQRHLPTLTTTDFNNIPGLGMEAVVDENRILMGSRTLLREHGTSSRPGDQRSGSLDRRYRGTRPDLFARRNSPQRAARDRFPETARCFCHFNDG
jgi:P-type E1-E2 ATPase